MNNSSSKKVDIYCVTLRDGLQGENMEMSLEDRLRAAKMMDELDVYGIEAGWPGAVPLATEFFKAPPILHNAKLAAFGSTTMHYRTPHKDANFVAVVDSCADMVTLFGKTWDLHVHEALRVPLEENFRIISRSIALAKNTGKEVHFDAEHFFDGYKENPRYAMATLKVAAGAGADALILCDTNGGTFTDELVDTCKAVKQEFPNMRIGIHAHNDMECAVANSLAAVRQAGVDIVHGALNGFGERCGNANLSAIIPSLVKCGYDVGVSDESLVGLTSLSKAFDEMVNVRSNPYMAYVGDSAFAHKGGVHVSAVKRNPRTYTHFDPTRVGNKIRFTVSGHAGASNVIDLCDEVGLAYPKEKGALEPVLRAMKKRELKGYRFERARESAVVLAATKLDPSFEPFSMTSSEVNTVSEYIGDNGDHDKSNAKVKLLCAGKTLLSDELSEGPVDALDIALRKALVPFFPELANVALTDYKVDLVDKESKTGAKTRVYIESTDYLTGVKMRTMGVSTNTIRASVEALVDAYKYTILAHNGTLTKALPQTVSRDQVLGPKSPTSEFGGLNT